MTTILTDRCVHMLALRPTMNCVYLICMWLYQVEYLDIIQIWIIKASYKSTEKQVQHLGAILAMVTVHAHTLRLCNEMLLHSL